MTRFCRWVLLLTCSVMWLAGCGVTATPALPPVTVAAISARPTDRPATPVREATFAPPATSHPALSPTIAAASHTQNMTAQLIRAAEAGETATVQQLLKDGADINGRDARGRTPVMAATHGNQVDTVRALIQAGADINLRDNRSDNPFLYAGAEGLLDILRLTIEAQADTRLTNRFGGTALIPAAERGHVDIVKELLTRTDVDVDHVNDLGWTALLEAIVLGDGGARHQQIVQLLVDYGADIRIADKDGVTPLEHARARGFTEIERILLAVSGQRDQRLIAAAGQDDVEAVRQLLAQGADVRAQDENGRTALIAAAYRNDLVVADVLIQAGADVNVQDKTKQSAYLIATSDGYVELLKRTLLAGADVHRTDSFNGTGLIRAADRGHVEIIRELLRTEIKIDHVNNLGWTALLEAIILGDGGARHAEVVRLLVEAGANVNLADADGNTPLAHAQRRGYTQIATILQQAGAR